MTAGIVMPEALQRDLVEVPLTLFILYMNRL